MTLILHPFLPLPPVNLAWECGASSRCWGVFPPQSKTVFKAPFADQHTELHITSPRPTLPCFSLWASVFFPFVGLLSQPIEMVTTITHPPKGLQAYSPKSSLRPLTRAIICLWVAGVAHSAPTEQKRALISPTKAGEKGIHLPQHFSPGHTVWRTQQENSKLSLTTFGDSCGQIKKTFLCLMIVNNIKGFMGNTTFRR